MTAAPDHIRDFPPTLHIFAQWVAVAIGAILSIAAVGVLLWPT